MIARLFFGTLGLILLAGAEATAAELPGPPPPPRYQIVLRYRIAAARDQHVLQYDALIAHLRALDFEFDPPLDKRPETDREDRSKNTLRGTVPSDQVLKILRNPNVASVLVLPVDFEYPPKDLDAVARIRLELAGGFGAERQRELADQVKAILHALNFREAPSYDHHGHSGRPFTRIAGTIPQGRLEVLLKDLRGQPAGWFAPRLAPGDLPTPLRNVNPVQLIEVERDSEPIVQVAVPKERSPEYLEKISSDLWALVGEKGHDNETVRVELVFAGTLAADRAWQALLKEAVPTLFVEGQVGQVVSVIVTHAQVRTLAALPGISTIRLPRLARVEVEPTAVLPGNNAKALAQSGLEELHRKGFRGQDVRLAVIDTDFRGWSELVKQGKLPPRTRLVDLTAERDPEILPAPVVYPRGTGPTDLEVLPDSAAKQIGHGTQCALAAALAAPQASLVLVRIDGSAPYELDELARYFRGGSLLSPYIDRRRDELVTARAELNLLRSQVLFERKLILESFTDERDLEKDFGFLGPVYGWVFSQRSWIRDQVAYVDKLEKALTQRNRRFFDLVEDIRSLAGITLVSNPLVWNEGYAVSAASPLSRALERQLASAPVRPGAKAQPLLWFQSAGNTRGQTWTGLFHDDDSNGLMEFAPAQQKLKPGAWTTELNFLAWKPFAKDEVAELPEGARLRIALQWREPHDPDYYLRAGDEDDLYRKPLAELRVALLRQRDPSFKTLSADAMELVAVSSGIPERLEHQPSGSIYQVVLETTLAKAGRYALRVERPRGFQWFLVDDEARQRPSFAQLRGLQPTGLRPAGVVTLPLLEKQWELQPRLFVELVDVQRRTGRVVFQDYATDRGSVGVPGDARSLVTVGAADWDDSPRPYSAGGPLAFAELAKKPTVLAYDALQLGSADTAAAFGTSIATAFAAGTAATLMSAGMSAEAALSYVRRHDGRVLKVPAK